MPTIEFLHTSFPSTFFPLREPSLAWAAPFTAWARRAPGTADRGNDPAALTHSSFLPTMPRGPAVVDSGPLHPPPSRSDTHWPLPDITLLFLPHCRARVKGGKKFSPGRRPVPRQNSPRSRRKVPGAEEIPISEVGDCPTWPARTHREPAFQRFCVRPGNLPAGIVPDRRKTSAGACHGFDAGRRGGQSVPGRAARRAGGSRRGCSPSGPRATRHFR
jgi:hypothetical protein